MEFPSVQNLTVRLPEDSSVTNPLISCFPKIEHLTIERGLEYYGQNAIEQILIGSLLTNLRTLHVEILRSSRGLGVPSPQEELEAFPWRIIQMNIDRGYPLEAVSYKCAGRYRDLI